MLVPCLLLRSLQVMLAQGTPNIFCLKLPKYITYTSSPVNLNGEFITQHVSSESFVLLNEILLQ